MTTKHLDTGYDQSHLDNLSELATRALTEARRQGASSAEAGISLSSGLSVNVRLGEVETVEHTRDKGLGITVYFGQKKGSASTTDFSNTAISDSVSAACGIAKYTSQDECAGLADAALMAKDVADLKLHHPWSISTKRAIEIATETEQTARDVDKRITNSEGASVSYNEGGYVYGNSHGFVGGYLSTRHGISCVVIAQDEKGMQRDYWYSVSRDAAQLENPADIGARAAKRSLDRLGARKLGTQTVPVLYAPDIARGVFGHFVAAIRGGAQYRKASFLLDHKDKQVFADSVRIREQPHLPGALGSSPFDNEGVATRDRNIVSDGTLMGYVLDSYSARKLGTETTANAGGVHNLTVESTHGGFEDMLRELDTGLLVTELMGTGVNVVTGDYSRGAAGYWVEGGEIQFPVHEITIASNLRDMFLGVRAIGSDVDCRGNILTGSLLIDKMTVAGE